MVFIGFISLFGFVGLTFIYGALAYNTKKLINNPLIKAQLELKKETSLLPEEILIYSEVSPKAKGLTFCFSLSK